jgi:hypothetical protein
MRYQGASTFVFTDVYGRTGTVYDMREIPEYQARLTIAVGRDVELDEVASRTYVFGEGGEASAYKLFEANMATILDVGFDMSLLGSLVVPR